MVCGECYTPYGDPGVARNRLRREYRAAKPERHPLAVDHPGSPLGRGMPSGSPLRRDGESHREAWMRLVRGDPCSFCGRFPFPCRHHGEGTIDHIDHKRGPTVLYGLHTWLNFTAACPTCNGSKDSEKLLLWLARRPVRVPPPTERNRWTPS